ncbi:MAG: tetratricopeptide repeat protein [Planctomycetaceae bacterium]
MNRRRLRLLASIVLSVGLAGLAIWGFTALRRPPPAAVSLPDLTQAHPRVVSAIEESAEQVRQRSRSGESWGEFGMVLAVHGFRREARTAFREAARLDPDEFRWAYYLAYLHEETSLEAAVDGYERALELAPDQPTIRIRLGNALLPLGRVEEAETQFRQAAKEQPESPFPQMGLARAALARQDLFAARRHFEAAAAAPGWSPRSAFAELIRINQRLGDAEAAARAERQVARLPETASVAMPDSLLEKIESEDALARGFAASADRLAARGDFVAAERYYRLLTKARPDMPGPLLNLANVLLMQGRAEESVEILRFATQKFPDDLLARFRFGVALHRAGQLDAAAEIYARCTRLKPDFAEAWYHLGLLHKERGEADAAEVALTKAVALDPRHAQAQLLLGIVLSEGGSREAAIPHMRAAVQLAPDDPLPKSYLEKALAELAASRSTDPTSSARGDERVAPVSPSE